MGVYLGLEADLLTIASMRISHEATRAFGLTGRESYSWTAPLAVHGITAAIRSSAWRYKIQSGFSSAAAVST